MLLAELASYLIVGESDFEQFDHVLKPTWGGVHKAHDLVELCITYRGLITISLLLSQEGCCAHCVKLFPGFVLYIANEHVNKQMVEGLGFAPLIPGLAS